MNASKPLPEIVFAHGRNRVAHELFAGLNVTEVLDYGCGNGRFATALAEGLGVKVNACDIDLGSIEDSLARKNGDIDFFHISENAVWLPLSDARVSAVTCCDVLEHMQADDRLGALRELRRVLSNDGALILTVPHKGLFAPLDPENAKFYFPRAHRLLFTLFRGAEKYQERYGGDRYGNFSSGARRHVHFSVGELEELLSNAGFQIESVRFFTLAYPVSHALMWLAEAVSPRLGWRWPITAARAIYTWDSDVEPGRLGFSVGVRAKPVPSSVSTASIKR